MRREGEGDRGRVRGVSRCTTPRQRAAGVTGVAVALKRSVERMGPARTARTLLRLNQAEGFDCMSCAWPDPERRAPAHRGVLRERGQGGRRGGDQGAGDAGVLRARTASPSSTPSPSTGSASRAGSPTRWSSDRAAPTTSRSSWDEAYALVADQLNALDSPGRGDLLHLGPDLERGGVRLPAVRPRVRHQQPAGLLQHVPRVDQHGAGRDHRHRQGQRDAGRRAQRRAAGPRRPEPGHQPPADAVGAGDRQAPRRQDRRDQPAARGRPGQLPQPAEAARRRRPRHRPGRPAPADQDQRRPGAVPGVRRAAARVGRARPRVRRAPTRAGSRPGATTSAGSTGARSRRSPGCPGRRSPRRPGCCATPTARCSAGRWG